MPHAAAHDVHHAACCHIRTPLAPLRALTCSPPPPPLSHPTRRTMRCDVDLQIHTPDSSRYWLADSYEARHAAGQEPQNIDKEFLRLWFRARCDPYKDEVRLLWLVGACAVTLPRPWVCMPSGSHIPPSPLSVVQVLPEAPRELVEELSRRYVYLYERITGVPFQPPSADQPVGERMQRNIAPFL